MSVGGEARIVAVRGTRDWSPADYAQLRDLEHRLLSAFARDGFAPMRTPVIEPTELHERKSGAGIVSKLFELAGGASGPSGLCLRPELTAGVVRAFVDLDPSPALPWRVAVAGPVFRYEREPDGRRLREFTQVGVELLGGGGPEADAEVIALAIKALGDEGIGDATLRLGHVGLILERLGRWGLPPASRAALVEMLSEAAAEGRDVRALDEALDRLAGWLQAGEPAEDVLPAVVAADDRGVDRLFRHLVPDVTGRRTGHEIVGRLRRKWDLGHTLPDLLGRLRDQLGELAALRGPAAQVLDRLGDDGGAVAAQLGELVGRLERLGVDPDRVEIDLGFGRGIGFYSQMIFEILVPVGDGGPAVEVGGGGRYDGLASVLGGRGDDRGVGFALGLERLLGAMDSRGAKRR